MNFLIADTFTASLARLTGEEQKAVKTTAFDLQLNPVSPGLSFHKLTNARDRNFWSVRVNRDVRLIVHRTPSSLLLCYVDHHDSAYRWAERRRLERHPTTGAAQLVEIRETVREIEVPRYVDAPVDLETVAASQSTPPLFEGISDDRLAEYGVPADWIREVREATEDTLFDLAEHLPAEAAEALLELATGGTPRPPIHFLADIDAFAHPDARRRFRIMANVEELERALDFPWEKWSIFLHPAQQNAVERSYGGPARVSGSAGTGKTIVALHRAVYLARSQPDARVLLATFSVPLADELHSKLRRLIGNTPRLGERLEVHATHSIARRLYQASFGKPKLVGDEEIRRRLAEAAATLQEHRFAPHFLWAEWSQIVDAWQLETWEEYRDVQRLGRRTRLAETQRVVLWSAFERVRDGLAADGLLTMCGLLRRVERQLAGARNPPFDFAVIDEAQDLGVAELRFLAALGGGRPDGLFFAGDLGQRIFQTPFSWLALGVDIRGRSHTLRVNYRTSHQIRLRADRLLPTQVADIDGNREDRRGTISVFNGPEPEVRVLPSPEAETDFIANWLRERKLEGWASDEIGVFVRSESQLDRAVAAVEAAGLGHMDLRGRRNSAGKVVVGTMHLAKGLEFRGVVVAACDDEVVPLQERIESIADGADLEEVYDTERHLLYVACTRARDRLLVTAVAPGSEFLEDLCDS